MSDNQKLLGDITAEALKKVGADRLARAYERMTGRPCNCANRRKTLNNIHRAVIGQKARPSQPAPQFQATAPVDELPSRQ